MAINLKRLTPKQLEQLSAQIESHKAEQRQQRIAALRAKVVALVQAEGLALEDLFARGAGTAKRRKVPAKYRNPANHSETWSGRGRQPRWYAAALKAGKSERALLIK
jgi:DNA-binding protein H-NS